MQQGGEVLGKAIAVIVLIVVGLASACAPAAPTPTLTPEPTAAPVIVRATKPEHLTGTWKLYIGQVEPPWYYRWDTDGTVWWAKDGEITTDVFSAKFWFEDGLYHEDESPSCDGLGIYEIDLEIQGGRAVRLRFNLIEDGPGMGGVCLRPLRYEEWRGNVFVRVN